MERWMQPPVKPSVSNKSAPCPDVSWEDGQSAPLITYSILDIYILDI